MKFLILALSAIPACCIAGVIIALVLAYPLLMLFMYIMSLILIIALIGAIKLGYIELV